MSKTPRKADELPPREELRIGFLTSEGEIVDDDHLWILGYGASRPKDCSERVRIACVAKEAQRVLRAARHSSMHHARLRTVPPTAADVRLFSRGAGDPPTSP